MRLFKLTGALFILTIVIGSLLMADENPDHKSKDISITFTVVFPSGEFAKITQFNEKMATLNLNGTEFGIQPVVVESNSPDVLIKIYRPGFDKTGKVSKEFLEEKLLKPGNESDTFHTEQGFSITLDKVNKD